MPPDTIQDRPQVTWEVVGRISTRVLLKGHNNKMAVFPERMVTQIEKLGITVVDKTDNYIL